MTEQKTVWAVVGYTRPLGGILLHKDDTYTTVLYPMGVKVRLTRNIFDTEEEAIEVAIKRAENTIWENQQAILTYQRLLTEIPNDNN